jgi:hypothetical protein
MRGLLPSIPKVPFQIPSSAPAQIVISASNL